MTGISAAEQAVLDRIDERWLVGLTQSLLRATGQNPPGGEAATVAVLSSAAAELGLEVLETPVEPGRNNLTITLPGGDEPGLLLLGHTDVVPVGDGWTTDPYGGQLVDGRIYGRGASDMKGGLAASLAAMAALRGAGLSRRVELAALVDEEETGKGIRAYVESVRGGELEERMQATTNTSPLSAPGKTTTEALPSDQVRDRQQPGSTAPDGSAPGATVGAGAPPTDQVRDSQQPGSTAPGRSAPGATVSAGAAPTDQVHGPQQPGSTAPGGSAPGAIVSAGAAPTDEVHGPQQPGSTTPGGGALGAIVSAGAAPTDQVRGGQRPGSAASGGSASGVVAGQRAFRGCITTEPTDLQTIIGARGDSYLRVEVHGRACHAGNPADGANAIYGAAAIVAEIERLHAELARAPHPLLGPATWSVGQINGGTGGSIVPAECVLVADRRLLPGESPAAVLDDLRQRVAALHLEDRELTVDLAMPMEMPAFETPADADLVRTVDAALAAAGGPGLPLGGWTAACDGGYVARDLGVPVVVLGPGSVKTQAHRADESVAVDELITAARAYTLTALRLLS